MKKQTLMILFLVALLCLSMLFVSCNKNVVGGGPASEAQVETEQVIEDVGTNYASIISNWTQYIEFNAPESVPVLNPNSYQSIAAVKSGNGVSVTVNGNFILVTTTTEKSYRTYKTISIQYEIYNSTTGKQIFNATVPAYRTDTGRPEDKYSFNFLNGIFEVRKQTYQKALSSYDSSYSYYDKDGRTLVSKLDESSYQTEQTSNGDYLITINDTCYLVRDGEIIYKFDKAHQRELPQIDLEHLDYKYTFENSTYRVFNSNYDLIATYTIPSGYDSCAHTILSNGNIFVQLIYNLDESAKDYDYSQANSKYNISHIIVDVKTGKATELKLGFVVANIVTNALDNGSNMTVKNNNQFAEVYKIVDGKQSYDVSFLILDNSMNEVKELQGFFKNQSVGTKFADNGDLLITARTSGYSNNITHIVDLSTSKINEFVKHYVLMEDAFVAYSYNEYSGYVESKKLYNYNFTEIYDLSDVDFYNVYENSILVRESSTDSLGNVTYYYNVIATNGTSCFKNCVATADGYDDISISYNSDISCFIVQDNNNGAVGIYNCNGVSVASGKNVNVIGSSEDGVTVRVHESDSTDYYYFFKY